jgi:sortase (surface protein transpeptidase)
MKIEIMTGLARHTSPGRVILLVIIVGFILSLNILLSVVMQRVPIEAEWASHIQYAATQLQVPDRPGIPLRLIIPGIHVDAPIEYVGVTKSGAMDASKAPSVAAWYKLGARPGEVGSAVIAGHFGWTHDTPAIFDALSTLHTGDLFVIEDEKGVSRTFVIRELKIYTSDEMPAGVFSSYDGGTHVNLITCGGAWNNATQNYSTRVVVFADLQP